jgi:hypothetical protein
MNTNYALRTYGTTASYSDSRVNISTPCGQISWLLVSRNVDIAQTLSVTYRYCVIHHQMIVRDQFFLQKNLILQKHRIIVADHEEFHV